MPALRRQGFQDEFISMIHACIFTTSLSVLVNADPTSAFHPQCGIRQGCPLSPYFFVLAVNELSTRLQNCMHNKNIQGVMLGPNSPRIQSLLFADDLIICGQATASEATNINYVLQNFRATSGQTPNRNKSAILFSKHVDQHTKNSVKAIFHVTDLPLTP